MNLRISVLKKAVFLILTVMPNFVLGQIADFEFEYDTVCVNDQINVFNNSSGALTYQWIFESAIITPDATVKVIDSVTIPLDAMNEGGPVYIDAVREGDQFYTFVAKHKGDASIWIQEYGNSLDNTPVNWELVKMPTENIEGLDIEKDDDGIYYGIVSGGTNGDIYRVTFINGINTIPVLVENLGFAGFTDFPHDINLIKQNGIWYAIITNSWSGVALTVLKFNDGLGGSISTIDAWSFNDFQLGLESSAIQGIATIKIDGQWYAMVTSTTGFISRIEFNDDFTQARAFNLGDIDSTLNKPRDISIISDCGMLTGFVVNRGDNSLGILHFDDGIEGDIWGEKKDFNGVYAYPHAISDVYRFGGDAIVIIPETDEGKLIKLKFTPSGGHVNTPFPDPTDFEPSFSYDTAGNYYVSLSINSDIASTVCKGIVVIDKPAVPDISSDPVCKGDSLKLTIYDHPDANYLWTYPDNSTTNNIFPIINTNGIYKLTISYGACYSDEASENVSVLDLPTPGILPQPAEVCQWEYIQLSGNATGGSPPYTDHYWSGYGDFLFDSLEIQNPNFMGRMGIEDEDYYISDMEWSEISYTNKPPQKDKTVEGNTIFVQFFSQKGIGMEPETEITYLNNKYFDFFRARIGIDDAISGCGSVEFFVMASDSVLFNSGVMQYYSIPQNIDIPISAFDSITLRVENGGDNDFCDIANWADARFVKSPPRLVYDLVYEVTDNFGCKNKDTAQVSVDTNDVHILIQPTDTSVCPGDTASLYINAYGPSAIAYQWQIYNGSVWDNLSENSKYIGATSFSLNVNSVGISDVTNYRCILSSLPCGKDTSDIARIRIKPVPFITDTFPVSSCGPETVTLSARTSIGEIQWFNAPTGGVSLVTSDSLTYALNTTTTFYLQPEASGCSSITRTPITAYYYDVPIIDAFLPNHASLCDLSDGSLQIIAYGTTTLEYSIDSATTWQSGDTFNGLLMGLYYVAVRYNNGLCESYLDSTAQILSLSAPLIDDVFPVDETDCKLNNGIISINVSGGSGSYEYSINGSIWQPGNVFTGLTPKNYQVSIRNDDSTCVVEYPEIITIGGFEEPTIYSATPGHVSDCDSADGSINISANGPSEVLLYSIDTINYVPSSSFTDLQPDTYHIAVKYIIDKCVTHYSGPVIITQPIRPVFDSIEVFPVTKCTQPDGSINIYVSSGEGSYEYYNNIEQDWIETGEFLNLSANNYSIFVRNGDLTCLTELDSTILVIEQCVDTIPYQICFNGNNILLDNYLFGISDTGKWNEISTSGYLNGNEFITAGLDEGKYLFAYAISNNNFTFEFDATIQKLAGTALNYVSCTKQTNLFNSLYSDSYTHNGEWYFTENGRIKTDSIVIHESGIYTYMYYHPPHNACFSDSTIVTVTIDNEPPDISCDSILNLHFLIPVGLEYYEVQNSIIPEINDNCNNLLSLTNSLNDSNSLINEKLTSGPYEIIWTVTDSAGNSAKCPSRITITDFQIPNIFTPNGDSFNDTWDFVIDETYPDAKIEIFDQKGNHIYTSDNGYLTKWDGTINSVIVHSGAYFYVIKNHGDILYKGSVTVIHNLEVK